MLTKPDDDIFRRRPYLLETAAVHLAGELGCSQAEAERRQMAARAVHRAERDRIANEREVANVKAKLTTARAQAERARTRAAAESNPVRAAQVRLEAAQHDSRAALLDARLRSMSSGRTLRRHLDDVETR